MKRALPTFYYHAHFIEMLDFVAEHYGHALLPEHVDFLVRFRESPKPAQCLYVRLVNRKGRVFSEDKLPYPELGDIGTALAALRAADLVGEPSAADFDDVLRFLTRTQIHAIVSELIVGVSKSIKKAELITFARQNCTPGAFVDRARTGRLFVQRRVAEIEYLLFLYFGRVQQGLSQFTMRDLGLVRTHSFRETYEPRYAEPEEALEHFYFATRLDRLARNGGTDAELLMDETDEWPLPSYPGSALLRDRFAYDLGRLAEKRGERFAALRLYQKGESPQCSEKVIRLLLADGQRDEARRFLEQIIDLPRGDEEYLFARDLYARKFGRKRTSPLTDALRNAETIEIDEAGVGAPERAAAAYFESSGVRAFRVENALWRTLFGLLFWDLLFEHEDASLHSPFEFLPRDLADGRFGEGRESAIAERLALLDEPAKTRQLLLKTGTRAYGTANGVFRWRRSVLDAVFALIDSADGAAIRQVLSRLCDDYRNSRHGYPDLMLVDGQGVRFVEVKTDGDQLRRNQLLRIGQLREAGFRADVVRIRWTLDPAQTYVVVDVETTGGRSDGHRVTEIGAVKLKDGHIVDRFETLVNPQRSIPAGITRLTGITPAMVADAPYFSDVADEFEAFLKDAIFVAHNVDFDYRFIAGEFSRLGRPFRYPKLCTCASMRKLYPGHRSYSLAALCETYGIPLKSHHRALCDAEAAAELLLLINEKRFEALDRQRRDG